MQADVGGDFIFDGSSNINRTFTVVGQTGAGEDFTVTVGVTDGVASVNPSGYVTELDGGVFDGDNDQDAADITGGTIEITISDDDAALVNGLNLEIDDVRIDDYTGIDFTAATDGESLADELDNNAAIDAAVYDADTGVLTLTAVPGSSIDVVDGFDAPLVSFDSDQIADFDADDEDLLNLSGLGLAADDFVGDIAVTVNNLHEAAQEAAGLLDEGEFGYFDLGDDTYVFANIDTEENQATSDDVLVELTGVTPVLTTDDFILT